MAAFLTEFWANQWAWFLIAVVLLGLELVATGVVFVWLAIAAAIVGAVHLVFPGMSWEVQFALFAALSFASVFLGRRFVASHPVESEDETLNRRGEQHIGRTYVVAEAISGGRGRVKVGDSVWTAQGPDAEAGSRVRVVAVEGIVLTVEPAGD
jgi:hypothetical protein